jgi:DNA-binding transcriptional LysR family regulator
LNTNDLEIFLILAATENMQQAALLCDKTPSMLSKTLKKLETTMGLKLFDRIGKNIKLNPAGQKLVAKASKLVAHTKQMMAEFAGLNCHSSFTLAGPSILMLRWASVVGKTLAQAKPGSAIHFASHYEQAALDTLLQGGADMALITASLAGQIPGDMHCISLGNLDMQVAAGKNHPLVAATAATQMEVDQTSVLAHGFISPHLSPYCGQARGIGCDGWPDELYPRKITMLANDYAIVGQLVKSGQVLGYMPDYWLRDLDLVQLNITDIELPLPEEILLVSYQSELVNLFKE